MVFSVDFLNTRLNLSMEGSTWERKRRIGFVSGFCSLWVMLATLLFGSSCSSHERKYEISPSSCVMYRSTQRSRLNQRVGQCFRTVLVSEVKRAPVVLKLLLPLAAVEEVVRNVYKDDFPSQL